MLSAPIVERRTDRTVDCGRCDERYTPALTRLLLHIFSARDLHPDLLTELVPDVRESSERIGLSPKRVGKAWTTLAHTE